MNNGNYRQQNDYDYNAWRNYAADMLVDNSLNTAQELANNANSTANSTANNDANKGNKFNASTFDWGGVFSGAGSFMQGILNGSASIIGAKQPKVADNYYITNGGSNEGGSKTTTYLIIGAVVVALIIGVVIFMKKK